MIFYYWIFRKLENCIDVVSVFFYYLILILFIEKSIMMCRGNSIYKKL